MKYKDYNDDELLSYIKEGNEEANEIMFNKYKPLITSLAVKSFSKCNNSLEVSDLVQEGMVGLSYAITTYSNMKDASFFTYAKKCIERKLSTAIKETNTLKNKYLNESISFENTTDGYSLDELLGDNSINPERLIISHEKEIEIYNLARKILTSLELEVFNLKASGFDYKEIADILDIDCKIVDNALTRIKNKFKNNI